jgi:hypothetical protein
MQTVHRTGLEFTPVDRLTKVLRGWVTQLDIVHSKIEGVKGAFAGLDSESLKGIGKQIERIGKLSGSLQGVSKARQTDAKAARDAIRLETQRATEAEKVRRAEEKTAQTEAAGRRAAARGEEKLRQERLKTQQLEQDGIRRTQAADQAARIKAVRGYGQLLVIKGRIRTEDERGNFWQNRAAGAATRAATEAERLRQTKMRTVLLEERIARQQERQVADQRAVLELQDRINSALPGPGNRIQGGINMARGGLAATEAVLKLGKSEDVRALLREQSGMAQMNLSKSEMAAATAGSERVRRNVQGLDLAGSLDVIKDLINITGSVKEAVSGNLAERLGQFRVTNQVAYGLTQNEGYQAVKSAEMLAQFKKGMSPKQQSSAIEGGMETINKLMAGSGGKIRPTDIYAFLKTAQSAKYSMDTKGLMNMAPIIQELGGMRAGTALMSMMQNLANGKATTRSVMRLLDMHLVDPKKIEYTTTGKVKGMKAGALHGTDLLRKDQLGWVEKFLMPKMKGKSIQEIEGIVNSITSNRTAAGLMMMDIAQNARIHKDAGLFNKARSIAQADLAQRSDNYLRAELDFNKAIGTLRQKLGIAILPTLTRWTNALTAGLNRLNLAITAHPVATKLAVFGTAIAGVATSVGGAIFVLKGASDALKGLAALRAVSAGVPLLTAGAGAAAGAGGGGLGMLFGGAIAGLGGALKGLAGLGFGGMVKAVGGKIGTLFTGVRAAIPALMVTFAPLLEGVGALATALAGPVAIGAIAVGAVILAWKTNFLGVLDLVTGLGSAWKSLGHIGSNAGKAIGYLWEGMLERIKTVLAPIGDRFKAIFQGLGQWINTNMPWLPKAVGWLGGLGAKAGNWVSTEAASAAKSSDTWGDSAKRWDESGKARTSGPPAPSRPPAAPGASPGKANQAPAGKQAPKGPYPAAPAAAKGSRPAMTARPKPPASRRPEPPTAPAKEMTTKRPSSAPRTGTRTNHQVAASSNVTVPIAITVNGTVPPVQQKAVAQQTGRAVQDRLEDHLATMRPTRTTPDRWR